MPTWLPNGICLEFVAKHSSSPMSCAAPGTAAKDVPPVGSVFNFVYLGNSGFGTAQSVMPSSSSDLISFKVVTPLGDIPLYSAHHAAAERTGVSFFDPFVTV